VGYWIISPGKRPLGDAAIGLVFGVCLPEDRIAIRVLSNLRYRRPPAAFPRLPVTFHPFICLL
jgi:hypothetical protein